MLIQIGRAPAMAGLLALALALLLPGAASFADAGLSNTLPPLEAGEAPASYDAMWRGFDPRAEPLEVEVLGEWEEEGVVLRAVRLRIGLFMGQKAKLAAVYGYPKGGTNLPGLVQIHGGGQFADYRACVANGKRGYATVSIAWAGRYATPDYRVGPAQVKLFWQNATDHRNFKLTTDWGPVDGYHAPGRNAGNQFPKVSPHAWTFDRVESPRNSGWFLGAMAARRAITFLEAQPEVDADRLGVYGHSMGGKLTVLTAGDPRIKAAAPSCGGISDRDNKSALFRATLGDDANLRQIHCPIAFLSPANDFHGRIGDLPRAVDEIPSREWRVVCSPHHNHQDTAPHEAVTLLWFDQHLRGAFETPKTPRVELAIDQATGDPVLTVEPDPSMPIASVDFYYSQHGKAHETSADRENTTHRFWRHVAASEQEGRWIGALPLTSVDKPCWAYGNITYQLPTPVAGVGYYYRPFETSTFAVSSLLETRSPDQLRAAGARATLEPSLLIEDFRGDWRKEWFSYRPKKWGRSTNKLRDNAYRAPAGAGLAVDVRSERANRLVVRIDDHAAETKLAPGGAWRTVVLSPSDFKNADGQSLADWSNAKMLTLSEAERLGKGAGAPVVGGNWKGPPPEFRDLRWRPSGGLNE